MTAAHDDAYVVLSHIPRKEGGWTPAASSFARASVPDWRSLLIGPSSRILTIWLVERTAKTRAPERVLAHLAGHAPAGVTRLYDRSETQ